MYTNKLGRNIIALLYVFIFDNKNIKIMYDNDIEY